MTELHIFAPWSAHVAIQHENGNIDDAFKYQIFCENEMRWCLYTVYQMREFMSINDDENLKYSIKLVCLHRILNCSHAIIYAEIYEKMLSGGLEVSFCIPMTFGLGMVLSHT